MVLRLFLLLFLSLCSFADVKYEFIRYTGDGSDPRTISSTLDTISMVIIAPLASSKYCCIRTASVDSISGTEPFTGATADSISYLFPKGTQVTKNAIRAWSGSNVNLGSDINETAVEYIMWVFSDPTQITLITDYYKGDGSSPRNISTGYADTLEAWFGVCPTASASRAGPSFWTITGYPSEPMYWGERSNNDISAFVANQFTVDAGAINDWNVNTYWYIWFGLKEVEQYVRLLSQVGDGDNATDDTLTYAPADSFRAFFTMGQSFAAGITAGGIHGSQWAISGVDSSIQNLFTTNSSLVTGVNTIWTLNKPDTMVIKGNSWLDVSGLTARIFAIGDTTASFSEGTPPTPGLRRQPCSGNTVINNKGNIEWDEKYK